VKLIVPGTFDLIKMAKDGKFPAAITPASWLRTLP